MKFKLLILSIFAISIVAHAQNDFKPKRITVFKDGTSFIEKTVTVPTKNKMVSFDKLPVTLGVKPESGRIGYSIDNDRITLGSLRFTAKDNELLQLAVNRNAVDSVAKQKEYESIADLLKINIGKKVRIIGEKDSKPVVAKIEKVIGNTVILKEGNSHSLIPISGITNIDFLEKYATVKQTVEHKTESSVSLEMKLLKDSKNQQVDMSYLQKGITWLPTYFIELKAKNKGQLTLEANLLNDIEDFENIAINFAVGVPSFSFKRVSDPLFSKKTVWEVLKELSNQQIQGFSTNIQMNMMSQRSNYVRNDASREYVPEMEGVGGEDLYFYQKQNISLKKHGRLKTQLLKMNFDYQDVYSCDLEQNAANRSYNSDTKTNVVWHSIRFKNSSEHPLTTGTVFFKKLDNGQIALVSQNQLDYTPKKEFTTAKMTVAPDILITSNDIETSRKSVNNDYLLNIEGEINIVNYKSFAVDLIVERKIIGTMLNSDKKWEVKSKLDTYNSMNPTNNVVWKLNIPAGKSAKIKYTYKIIVD
jgi:hypothetical protein